jgi:hypothetical protein
MLENDHRDRRQFGHLMATWTPRGNLLSVAELVPAAVTGIRVVIDELIDLILGQKLATRPLVPKLGARLALPVALRPRLRLRARFRAPLGTRLRRILRRRLRAVARALPRLLLQAPDPLLQPHPQQRQPLHRRRQLHDHPNAALTPRVIDRLRLSPLHTNKFDAPTEVPSSKRPQLNAYKKPALCRTFRGSPLADSNRRPPPYHGGFAVCRQAEGRALPASFSWAQAGPSSFPILSFRLPEQP